MFFPPIPYSTTTTDYDRSIHLSLIYLLHELNNEVHQFMLQHLLRVRVCDQEGDIIALSQSISPAGTDFPRIFRFFSTTCCLTDVLVQHTLIAFLLRMKNASALCVKNLVNLCTRISSISSACFILMLTRTLFTEGSINTFSFSFRDTWRGFRRTSGELAASISGTLWRSEVWEAKFERARAAVKEDRTHWR